MSELQQQLARSSHLNQHRNMKEMLQSALANKTQLHHVFQTVSSQGWSPLTKWSKQGGKSGDQLLLLSVIRSLLQSAFDDVHSTPVDLPRCKTTKMQQISSKRIDSFSHSIQVLNPVAASGSKNRLVRQRTRPLVPQDFIEADSPQSGCETSEAAPTFSKKELLTLARSKELPQVISGILSECQVTSGAAPGAHAMLELTFAILKLVAQTLQISYSKGEIYEIMSAEYHKYGIFAVLIGNLSALSLKPDLLRAVVKSLEFISITSDGLDLLYANSGITVEVIDLCFQANRREDTMHDDQDSSVVIQDMETLYPAATILLDLTANEDKIGDICAHCRDRNMFAYIIHDKLSHLLANSHRLHSTP